MNLSAKCPQCDELLEETDAFVFLGDDPEGLYARHGEPLRCPCCGVHYVVKNGLVVRKVEEDIRRREVFQYMLASDQVFFVANMQPTPDNFETIFCMEDMAASRTSASITSGAFADLMVESDTGYLRALVDQLPEILSIVNMAFFGEAYLTIEVPPPEEMRFSLLVPRLTYHELARRVFAFYKPGTALPVSDPRFYALILKAARRIRHHRNRQLGYPPDEPSKLDPVVLRSAQEWTERHYRRPVRLSAHRIRIICAILKH
jgi:hypothetical protein